MTQMVLLFISVPLLQFGVIRRDVKDEKCEATRFKNLMVFWMSRDLGGILSCRTEKWILSIVILYLNLFLNACHAKYGLISRKLLDF